ncbi:MAG TPA: nucleotide exchange factor GrpE [Steroidobacteraceae bacterium]|nr:nucleotide exchange factor GrpE [Steroidobacteraceae bacterium]
MSEASQQKAQSAGPTSDDVAANGTQAAAGGDLETLRQALAAAEEQARNQRDLYMRAMAEMDNVRKRNEREKDNARLFAIENFVAELLPVRDSLEQAVRQGAQGDVKTLLAGQDATLKLLDRAFEKNSVRTLDKAGVKFDPAEHEAVLMQPTADAEPGSVLQVVQTGYQLNGRLVRPARVIVAKAIDG